MAKDDQLYLGHMLDMAQKARLFVEGKDRADFDADEPLRLALTHLLQNIGEAARHVSEALQQATPQIAWPAIVGMRNRIVHEYFRVDESVVWKTVTGELPSLILELEKLVLAENDV